MNNGITNTRKLEQLTALRFFAAILVVFHHLAGTFGVKSAPINLGQGVSFFFVLSGFILTYVYPRFDGPADIRRFFMARWARLWPAYLASFIVGAILTDYYWNFETLIPHLLMVQAWIPVSAYYFSYNGVAWSVSTELLFYVVFPLLLLFRPKNSGALFAVALTFLLLWLLFVEHLHLPDFGNPASPQGRMVTKYGLIYISPIARVFEFVFGVVVARLWQGRSYSWSRQFGTTLEVGAVGLCVLSMYCSSLLHEGAAELFGVVAAMWLLHSGSFFAFGVLIFVFAAGRGWISGVLTKPILVMLGEISFSIYLIHNLLINFFVRNLANFYWLENWQGLAVFFMVLIGGSYLIWTCVEQPGRRILLRNSRLPGAIVGARASKSISRGVGKVLAAFLLTVFGGFSYLQSFGAASDKSASELTPDKYLGFVGAKFSGALELRGVSVFCHGDDTIARFVWKKTGEVSNPLATAVTSLAHREGY